MLEGTIVVAIARNHTIQFHPKLDFGSDKMGGFWLWLATFASKYIAKKN